MPENIYPDLTNSKFDIQYARLKVLPSDIQVEGRRPGMFPGGFAGDVPALPYNIYLATITQSGTSNPVATENSNNTITGIVWTRNSPGNYTGTLASAFPAGRTYLFIQQGSGTIAVSKPFLRAGDNTVNLQTWSFAGAPADGLLTSASIQIIVTT